MKKEKVFEYIFKVSKFSDIDIERIARENPNSEMIVVIPKKEKEAIILIDRNFEIKHGLVKPDVDSHHFVVGYGYISSYVNKETIQVIVDRYHKAIAIQKPEPKPKQTVTVKCFGDTLPF